MCCSFRAILYFLKGEEVFCVRALGYVGSIGAKLMSSSLAPDVFSPFSDARIPQTFYALL